MEYRLGAREIESLKPMVKTSFAHDVISSHWRPSWLILQITLAVYSEILVSIFYFIISLSVLWMLILKICGSKASIISQCDNYEVFMILLE